jgi:hypothetical protein
MKSQDGLHSLTGLVKKTELASLGVELEKSQVIGSLCNSNAKV